MSDASSSGAFGMRRFAERRDQLCCGRIRANRRRRRKGTWRTRWRIRRRDRLCGSSDRCRCVAGTRCIPCSAHGSLHTGRHRSDTDKSLVLGLREQEEGAPKENADGRGSDETDQDEIEHETDVKPFRQGTALWLRGRRCFPGRKAKQLRRVVGLGEHAGHFDGIFGRIRADPAIGGPRRSGWSEFGLYPALTELLC